MFSSLFIPFYVKLSHIFAAPNQFSFRRFWDGPDNFISTHWDYIKFVILAWTTIKMIWTNADNFVIEPWIAMHNSSEVKLLNENRMLPKTYNNKMKLSIHRRWTLIYAH